jgi:hypothetical protein
MSLPLRHARALRPLSLCILAVLTAACDPEGGSANINEVEPYVLKGTVKNAAGAPLEGVRVYAYNTALWSSYVVTVTDGEGHYRLELDPDITTTYEPEALLQMRWNGADFVLPMHPDNPNPFAHSSGAVRHFTWQLQGDRGSGDYYGARIDVTPQDMEWNLMDRVELDFEPIGPRIDGSEGTAFTLRMIEGLTHQDVPVGQYRVSARDTAGQIQFRVRQFGRTDFVDATEVQFEGLTGYLALQVTAP